MDISSQVKQNSAPFTYGEDRDFDVVHIVFLRSVVVIIAETMVGVVCILIHAIDDQFFFR